MKTVFFILLVFSLTTTALTQDGAVSCEQPNLEDLQVGESAIVSCDIACTAGNVWGTDVYTTDSDLCTAAAHAGVIELEEGGIFVVNMLQGREAYIASEQNGIVSSEWGNWDLSYTFEPVPLELEWNTTAQEIEGDTGTFISVNCPENGTLGTVWGTNIYTDDSSICTAALHSGLIAFDEGGQVYLSIVDGQESYTGSSDNDVDSLDYGSWSRSFTLSSPNLEVEWSTRATELVGTIGSSYKVTCPSADDTSSSLWGTDIYTDDSSICVAAVHAGVIDVDNGGQFIVSLVDGQDGYEGSEQNGIESSDWTDSWERSFVVGY